MEKLRKILEKDMGEIIYDRKNKGFISIDYVIYNNNNKYRDNENNIG